ncbi:putative Integral membrane protein [Streptomyces viridochromogenes Tue57]|uniref:Putative Integral membrane protein n=1 Tax=Streptomyces viridochromogenes Tue57 TaxID=1160705 RepID=L8P7R3_STRVR|nr:putative Integral membrane protein [Streptomyces viridochromogenes Tue57]
MGWSSPIAAYAAAANPAATATSTTVTRADAAGRTARCTASQPRGSGVRREASRAISRIPAHQPTPPSSVGARSTVKPTAASASMRSPIRSGSSPPMPPMSPTPGISIPPPPPPPAPPPGRSSSPSELPSIVMTSCPAQASPPSIAANSATTAPARARSSAGAITTPALRKDRKKNHDSSTAPTRLTPSGVISMAVDASAPVSPNADTSPDGVTEPPAPRATSAAVIGPREPAVSASSRCRPSAAVPAIPINAQLTAVIADSRTSPHGSRVPCLALSVFVDALMADPPDPRRGRLAAHVPLAWITTLRAGFNPVNGTSRCGEACSSQGPTFSQGAEPEIVPDDVRHP